MNTRLYATAMRLFAKRSVTGSATITRMHSSFSYSTPVLDKPSPWKLDHSTDMVFVGSCFSENISEELRKLSFRALSNPMGIIYNPLSIAQCVQNVIDQRLFNESDIM
jgi:hypothetical protein